MSKFIELLSYRPEVGGYITLISIIPSLFNEILFICQFIAIFIGIAVGITTLIINFKKINKK
jgi:hypothetical protein